MKKIILILFLVITVNIQSQDKHFLNVLFDTGYMINADKGYLRPGLGFSLNYLVPVNSLYSSMNYFTLSSSLINYPHTGYDYSISHFNNGHKAHGRKEGANTNKILILN